DTTLELKQSGDGKTMKKSLLKKSRKKKAVRQSITKKKLFKQLEKTKEYSETYFYGVRYETQTHNLVPINKFWCSYAEHLLDEESKTKKAFLSKHWLVPTNSLNETLLALAVMDLSLSANGPTLRESKDQRDPSVYFEANAPCIVMVKQLKEVELSKTSLVSINASFFDPNDTYVRDEDGEKQDKVVDTFVPGKVYGVRTVVTNLSSTATSVELLVEIPQGSIPVSSGYYTKTSFLQLESFNTTHLSFHFYWPSPGKYAMFPMCVSRKGKIIGNALLPKVLEVAYPQKDKKLDVKSWEDVVENGKDSDVLTFLTTNNPFDLDLSSIYHRCKNVQFFKDVCKVLRGCGMYNDSIWGYAVVHNNCLEELREFLLQNSFDVEKSNTIIIYTHFIYSPWISYDNVENNVFAHLEYIPLVNARAHLLGKQQEILNDAFKDQYQKFLERVSYSSTSVKDISNTDKLSLTYYLLLQERIQEAMEVFSLLDEKVCTENVEILFDYFKAYMSMFNENENEAKKLASSVSTKYRSASLPKRLNRLFEDIEVLVNGELDDYRREEDESKTGGNVFGLGDRDRAIEKLSKMTPSLEWEIDNITRTIRLSYQLVKNVTINFYVLNTEILFSQNPFFNEDGNDSNNQSAFSYISPKHRLDVKLPDLEKDHTLGQKEIEIPLSLKNQNLYIQVVGETLTSGKAFYDNQLLLQVKENYGQLRVLNKNTNKPVKKAYVKVYAKTNNGSEFYKDGYTDLCGKFDYVSISTDQLNRTTQLAILVSTASLGCVIKQVNKPKE
ncbi:hypothetical protein RFI_15166, partial [Reticulomyxa filosa]